MTESSESSSKSSSSSSEAESLNPALEKTESVSEHEDAGDGGS